MAFEFIAMSVTICCVLGVLLNTLLLYVAGRYSYKMGTFKYLLMFFSFVELLFSAVVLVAHPMFYAFHYRLILMAQNTRVSRFISRLLAGIYCAFYEVWLGLVVLLFVYKYVALCQESFFRKVGHSIWLKLLIFAAYVGYFSYSFICGMIFCGLKLPMFMRDRIFNVFKETEKMEGDAFYGTAIITFLNENDEFSVYGFFSVFDHFLLIGMSFTIIIFCGWRIWKKINEMQENCDRHYRRNIQIFYTLVLQAAVPFVLYQLPTAIFVGEALLEDEPKLINLIPLWSLLMSVPKVIDPIVILFMIKEYRLAIRNMFAGVAAWKISPLHSITQTESTVEGVTHPTKTDSLKENQPSLA